MIYFLLGDAMEMFDYKKKYGQNFLNDKTIIEKIVDSIPASCNDLIIEIGPGSGALTKIMKRFGAHILAFEIDKETSKFLSKLEDEKTKIIYNDFLESDIDKCISEIEYSNLYIIGNIPYYITTPIIKKITNLEARVNEVVLMVQKEFADRICAEPGSKNYGSLTVYIRSKYNVKKIEDVNKKSFTPVPKVDSSVIKLSPHDNYQIENKIGFENFIKEAFKFKRKTLKNNLTNYNLDLVNITLNKYGYSISNRAEEIPVEIFIDLYNSL